LQFWDCPKIVFSFVFSFVFSLSRTTTRTTRCQDVVTKEVVTKEVATKEVVEVVVEVVVVAVGVVVVVAEKAEGTTAPVFCFVVSRCVVFARKPNFSNGVFSQWSWRRLQQRRRRRLPRWWSWRRQPWRWRWSRRPWYVLEGFLSFLPRHVTSY